MPRFNGNISNCELTVNLRRRFAIRLALSGFLLVQSAGRVSADIYQWEYFGSPSNNNKQPTNTLTVDGAGANAVPGADLSNRNLTMAYLQLVNLTGANLTHTNLTLGYLDHAVLTGVSLGGTILDNATLYVATIPNADFRNASIQGTDFTSATLTGARFDGMSLASGKFDQAYMANANFSGANLTGSIMGNADLANVNFQNTNLSHASLIYSSLAGANFTNAIVAYANLKATETKVGLSLPQLYSTASYQNHDLPGIVLAFNSFNTANFASQNLPGADFNSGKLVNSSFANSNLTGADFRFTDISGVDFTDSVVAAASFGGPNSLTAAQLYSTASFKQRNLQKITLNVDISGWNLSQQDLRGANLVGANLSNVSFSQARIEGAVFPTPPHGAITPAQLYSTRSYSEYSLHGINISTQTLNGWNFRDQDLTSALFFSTTFTNSDFSRADLRGSLDHPTNYAGNILNNTIRNDGTVQGLNLTAGDTLRIRDYDANDVPAGAPAGLLPIRIKNSFAMNAASTLKFTFEADNWGSTVSFDPSITVQRAGTLDLGFAPDVFVPSQIGRTFQLFNWAGVTPTGAFNVSSPYTWDLSNLYTTGAVTLLQVPFVPGDFNHDGSVDTSDYVLWRKGLGATYTQQDYTAWRAHFAYSSGGGSATSTSNVPEPSISIMFLIGAPLWILSHRASSQKPLAV